MSRPIPTGPPPQAAAPLPWMGLGLSTNLSERDLPHPYRLWDLRPEAFDYVEYSAPLSLEAARRDASLFAEMWARRDELPVLFHPVHLNLYGPELESETALRDLSEHARGVGAPWVSNDLGWWHRGGRFFPGHLYLPPPLTRAGLADCAAHVSHVQARLPVPLAVENPAVITRRGGLHVLDFLAEISERTGALLLLDLGHLLSYQLAHGLPPETGLDGFPGERVVEIHLAGGVVTDEEGRAIYVDDHSQAIRDEVFELLERVVPLCPRLRAVTYEADGHPAPMALRTLERLREQVPRRPRHDAAPAAPAPRAAPSGGFAPRSDPWRIYDESYGRRPSREDGPGLRAERAFRLMPLAQRIDRVFPLSRLLLAGSRAGLADFAASAELRDGFAATPGRDAAESFARYARRRLREAPDEALATVLAFETWALERVQRAAGEQESEAVFPVDLSEVLWAGGALRRHLAGRAEACGVYDASAVESLRQVARRAPPGPWRLALRRREGRLEVRGLATSSPNAPGASEPARRQSHAVDGRPGSRERDG